MKRSFKAVLSPVCAALLIATPVSIAVSMTPSAAFAEKGGNANRGNGNRNERSNRGNSRTERASRGNNGNRDARGNSANNGRGALARELGGLNAAHASQNGLANASPNSATGKLYVYQQAARSVSTLQAQVVETGDFYRALTAMSEEQFVALNPTLDYASTLTAAGQSYQDAMNALSMAETDASTSLSVLTGGRALSDSAIDELHALLGL